MTDSREKRKIQRCITRILKVMEARETPISKTQAAEKLAKHLSAVEAHEVQERRARSSREKAPQEERILKCIAFLVALLDKRELGWSFTISGVQCIAKCTTPELLSEAEKQELKSHGQYILAHTLTLVSPME